MVTTKRMQIECIFFQTVRRSMKKKCIKEMIHFWPSSQEPGRKKTGKSETKNSGVEAYELMGVGTI